MIREALEWLGKTITTGKEARTLDLKNPRLAYVDQGGVLTPITVPPALRSHKVESVDDLAAAAEKWTGDSTVWIGTDAVRLVLDDADRRDVVTLPLVKSPQFTTLEQLAKTPLLDQQALIRRLRVDLPGAERRTELLSTVRKIKFRQSTSGEDDIQHGKESLGRAIEAQVTGSGDIPETVVVTGPVYCNHGEREQSYAVGLDLEILPSEQKFRLCPLPDELDKAARDALQGIRDRLNGALTSSTAIFFGTP